MLYGYDGLGRLYIKRLSLDSTENSFDVRHAFEDNEDGTQTTLISTTSYEGEYNGTTVSGSYYSTYHNDNSVASQQVVDSHGTITTEYEYDDLGQLISVDDGTNEYTYTYDAGGNLTQKTYATSADDSDYTATYGYDSNFTDLLTSYTKKNGSNQVIFSNTYNYTDASGNTFVNPLSITQTEDGTTRTLGLTWREGRTLESITTPDGTVKYEYNENGQRVLRQLANGARREYYYNGTQLEYIKIINANGVLNGTLRYIYNSAGQAEYIMFVTAAKASTPTAYNLYYILRDNTGVIQKLIKVRKATTSSVTPTLSVAVEYNYDPYGKLLSITKASGESVGTYNPLVYKDYIWDSETDWYYCNSRYYDPETGRWVNGDSVISEVGESVEGYNLFAYCMSDPINMSDSTGHWPRWITATVAAVAAVVAVIASAPVAATVAVVSTVAYVAQSHHYDKRKAKNTDLPANKSDAINQGWKSSEDRKNPQADCHQYTSPDKTNVKFVSPDGHREVIYNSAGDMVLDSRDIGTYNFSPSGTFWGGIGHFFADMLPWYLFGNDDDDPGPVVNEIIRLLE